MARVSSEPEKRGPRRDGFTAPPIRHPSENVNQGHQDQRGEMVPRAEARYRIGHNKNPVHLYVPNDGDALIDDLLAGPAHENLARIHSLEREDLASGSPDHELMVGVDRELGVGLLSFMDADGNFVSAGSVSSTYCIQGHLTEFPESSGIPLDVVRRGLREFISTGGMRPEVVPWVKW
ncbi:hypothetical protein GCM10022221_66480 [Actinocorallia aurea]